MAGGKKVECVLFRSTVEGAAPGLLLVHDHGSHARRMMGPATGLATRGYTVMLVSLPGYGLSEGPADLGGPRTVAALGAALDRLKRTPGVDSTHLAAWGIGRGAGPVASLATGRGDLAAVVLQSGIYDLWATSRATAPEFRETIVREAGRDSSAWRARSPLLRAASVKAATLVLHRESDNLVPADPARGFAAAIQAAGGTVESKFFPGTEHALSRSDVNRSALAFLAGKLGK
jgi:dipeptidyl aminopeptidase/acylaminoacyl peptidase